MSEVSGNRIYMELVDKAHVSAIHRHNFYLWGKLAPAAVDFQQMIERLRLRLVGYNTALVWLWNISV